MIAQLAQKTLLISIAAGIGYLFSNEIKQFTIDIFKYTTNMLTCTLKVKTRGNHNLEYAIRQELEQRFKDGKGKLSINSQQIGDGTTDPCYELDYCTYRFYHDGNYICVNYGKDEIIISAFTRDINYLHNFTKDIYNKHITADNALFYYISKGDDWGFPIIRRPTLNIRMTNDMKRLYDDVESFFKDEKTYTTNGYPYRKGYFIIGEEGTGKTSMVEILAQKFKMNVYNVNFSNDMTNTMLKKLVSNAPPKSLIVFDEFDKDYLSLGKNRHNQITDGGILSAIDGCPRISYSSIILMIANDITKFNAKFMKQLKRSGRIDETFIFTEKI